MKLSKINNAFSATEEITKQNDLTIKVKWTIFNIRKQLSSHVDFYGEEIRKLLDEYKPTVEGTILRFEKKEQAAEFSEKRDKIDNFEVEITIEKASLNLSDIPNITVQQMEQLEDFITFNPE